MNKCTFTTLAALSFFMLTADANALFNNNLNQDRMQTHLNRQLTDDGGSGGGGA